MNKSDRRDVYLYNGIYKELEKAISPNVDLVEQTFNAMSVFQ